ncbi:DedA family protein [Streptomyces sp. 8K308]|uniref:DedA family protein n=1 Tax=Streptomyces sp. 8K308 TaxID=2530388 RepID=UPI0010535849|nr:DedA family protein [Streptomyces sp. 8K308]TDC10601.1 DedA family protein [Streptomyces sp. 8K308]
MDALTDLLGDVPPAPAYLLLAAIVFAESILLIGAFVPTLTTMLTAGALSRAETLDLALVILVAVAAVVCGDALGHRTGRTLGARLYTGRLGRRVPAAAWRRARGLAERRGGQAVFICRFLPVARTVAPYLVGAGGLPYRRMAPYSVLAAVLWATAEAVAGYLAAESLDRVISWGSRGVLLLSSLAALVAAVIALRHWRRCALRRHAVS